ncbi:MAG: sodium:solute symporter family protein [Myxococcales bacterium]
MTGALLALLAYVAAQLLLGVLVSRRIKTEDDYLVAGRSLGPVMATSSIFATWFGAESCVGAAGQVFEHGLSAVSADPFGYGLCLLLFGALFASPLWARKLTTLADLFRERYSPGVERLVALMLIPGSLLWASAQIRAFGHVLAATGHLAEPIGIALAAVLAVTYTSFGGLLADAYADLIQGGVLITCLLILLVAVVLGTGGVTATWTAVTSVGPNALEAPRHDLLASLNDWAIPILGSLFAQELVARTSASRSRQVAQRSVLLAAVVYLLVGSIPVVLGAIAHTTLPGADPEQVLATLAQKHLPSFGYLIFAGALVSAILSTVDSALLVCGSLVSHNLAGLAMRDASEDQKVLLARVSVVAFSGVAYLVARSAESVHGLVQEASAFGSAGVCVAGTLGLFSRRGGALSAYGALVAGTVAWLYAAYVAELDTSFLCSLAAAFAAYVVCSLFEGDARLAADDVRRLSADRGPR